MNNFFTYWYVQSASRFFQAYRETLSTTEETFAISQTIKNISKPLFQDYTLGGRVVGVLLRCVRIIGGLFSYLLLALLFISTYLLWLAFPAVSLVSLVGSLIGVRSL